MLFLQLLLLLTMPSSMSNNKASIRNITSFREKVPENIADLTSNDVKEHQVYSQKEFGTTKKPVTSFYVP